MTWIGFVILVGVAALLTGCLWLAVKILVGEER